MKKRFTYSVNKLCKAFLAVFFLFGALRANAQISVTASIGATGTTYTTLGAAFTAINAGTHQGTINISVTAGTTETTPATLNGSGVGSANYFSVLIKPATGVTATITAAITTNGPIFLNGASNVTIDGSNNGTTSQNLTIRNTSAGYAIRMGNPASGSCGGDVIKNCIITGNGSTNATAIALIVSDGGGTVGATGVTAASDNTIQNNMMSASRLAILTNGPSSTTTDATWTITGNRIFDCWSGIRVSNSRNTNINNNNLNGMYGAISNTSPPTIGIQIISGQYATISTNTVSAALATPPGGSSNSSINCSPPCGGNFLLVGIQVTDGQTVGINSNIVSSVITGATIGVTYTSNIVAGIQVSGGTNQNIGIGNNTITGPVGFGLGSGSAPGWAAGIQLSTSITGADVYSNQISGVNNTSAQGAFGIYINPTGSGSNINVYNNFIANIKGSGSNTIASTGHGIYMDQGDGVNIYQNSINQSVNQNNISSAICFSSGVTTAGAVNLEDNIFVNKETSGTPYSIYCAANKNIFATIDYNDYYASSGNMGNIGGANYNTLANMQTNFGGNTNSINFLPTWTSSTDLHLTPPPPSLTNQSLNVTGNSLVTTPSTVSPPSVTINTDIDGNTRFTPTLGADELVLCILPTIAASSSSVCPGATINLSDATTGGTWTSSNTAIATVTVGPSSTAVVTGVATTGGTVTISYQTSGGCSAVKTITVNAPPAITGATSVCLGSTTALTDAAGGGGTWSSVSTGVATIGLTTGVLSGFTVGSSVISFTSASTGCSTTITESVVAPPGAITGTTTICPGKTTTLNNGTAGGTWSSGSPGIATVVTGPASSTTVTGVSTAGGTTTITYSTLPGACFVTTVVTVSASPAITGATTVCPGSTITLSNAVTGGAWSSSSTALATVTSGSGIVSGVSSGTDVISYTNLANCVATYSVTVNQGPPAFTITPPSASFCTGYQMLTVPAIPGISNTTTFVQTSAAYQIPDFSATGYADSILVSGIPAGSIIIDVSVKLNSVSMNSDGHLTFNVQAPNGQNLNLVNKRGGNGNNFTNTVISSLGGTTFASSAAPFTTGSPYAADATAVATLTGPAAFPSTTTSWNALFSTANGYWKLCARDWTSGTTATVNQWSLIIHYTTPGTYTWTPATGLYTNSTLSSSYVSGAAADTVYASPPSTTTYTATASISGYSCTSASTSTITINGAGGGITGVTNVCAGLNTTLSTAVTGGSWSSSNTAIATVTPGPGAGGGVVYGVSAGTAVITYSNGCIATTTVTVLAAPAIVSGATTVCYGGTTTLSNNGSPTGTWSSGTTTIATVDPVSGIVTGVSPGTTFVTATNICGSVSASLTVSPPSAITGVLTFCQNATTTLSNAAFSGTWSSSAPGIATTNSVGSSGLIVGIGLGFTPGPAQIVCVSAAGCIATTTITTTSAPTGIFGVFSVCTGLVTNLTDGTIGGVWTSTNTSVATVGSTGDVHGFGVSGGSTVISYAIGSCAATATVLVNPLPGPILGPSQVCALSAITLTNDTTGGTWSSSNTAAATVGLLSGSVTGVSPVLPVSVTDTITYRLVTGCQTTKTITVNPLPAVITGNTTICAGQTTILSDITANGTWSSNNTAVATIAIPASGTVTGAAVTSQGTATISYTLPTGCFTTTVVTVNPLPGAITGAMTVCAGATSALTDAPAGGTWISGNTAAATIDPNTGVLTGAGVLTQQTTLITYSLSTGCSAQATATVNPVPVAISGGAIAICAGATAALTDQSGGGTWSSSNTNVATVVTGTGAVTGSAVASQGTDTIIYRLPTGCSAQTTMTVNPAPTPIIGNTAVCVGLTIALTDGIAGGTWSSSTTNISIGTSSGIVTGLVAGSPVVTYTLPTGCTRTVNITVNALPTVIAGAGAVCAGLSTTLSDGTAGGTWSSSNTNVATVGVSGAAAGIVTGRNILAVDSAAITYTLGTGCLMTRTVVVNPLPVAITGITSVCVGLTTQLSDGTAGGTWSTGNTTIATIGSVSGQVTGGAVATQSVTPVTYTLIATGCTVTTNVTVNPLPTNITGNTAICAGLTTILSNGTVGGTWTSGNTAVATVLTTGASSGVVTGVSTGAGSAGGTAVITYTLGSGCIRTATVTVNPLPGAIIGNLTICAGLTTTLSDTTSGGTWSSATTGVATVVGGTGVVTGSNVSVQGTSRITYTIISTGCTATANVTVNPLPGTINGSASLCQGTTINLSEATAGGTWSSSNTLLATISGGPGTGSVLFAGAAGGPVGVDTVTYTLGTGCIQTKTVTVNLQPAPVTGGPLQLCNHSSASLSDVTGGGTWSSSNTAVATVDGNGLVTGSIPGAGIGGGTANIIYSIGGCSEATFVNVAVQPVGITGVLTMCNGAGTTLHDATPGGVWSAGNTVVSVVSAGTTGTVSSNDTGQSVITYAIGNCSVTTTVTVNLQPSQITGTGFFCNLSSVTLSDAVPGGVWSSSSSNVAVGSATGVVTGVHAGTAVISYTEPVGGCFAARSVTINIQPSVITGTAQVCNGLTTQLSDSAASGTWSVSAATISIATVSVSGQVTGLSAGAGGNDGVAVISYTIGSCSSVDTVLVHPLPSVMTGAFFVCAGSQTTLGDLSAPGTWSSNTPAVATIGVATGIVSGVTTGVTMITYTLPTGCITAHSLTVIAAPAAITGSNKVCEGGSTQLSDTTTGGVWTSSNTGTAQIGSLSGIVTGVSAGTVVISYTLGSGCRVVAPLVVHPLSPVTGTATVCMGLTTNLSDTTVGGIWSSGNTNIATVSAIGVVSGVGSGTAVISYTLPTGCVATATVTTLGLPALITGITGVCQGQTTMLSDASGGGVWSSANTVIATIDPLTGQVTGGSFGGSTAVNTTIIYTQGGCPRTTVVTVNPPPAPISGSTDLCVGSAEQVSDATAGGAWTSSNTAAATIDAAGVVSGVSAGTTTIIYTSITGCTTGLIVTVHPLPSAISGNTTVCEGSVTQLSDSPGGGGWTSGSPLVATVNFTTGMVTGVSGGTAVITYRVVTGCMMTTTVTVHPLPSGISGSNNVCEGSQTNLFCTPAGGAWSSSNSAVATIDAVTGVVSGLTAGTTLISYTVGTGCASTLLMTVNPLPPAITGISMVCTGMTTQLFDAAPGGTWSSSNTAIGTVDQSGVVYGGTAPGSFIVTYTLPTGCYVTIGVGVNIPPVAIGGLTVVCEGSRITLSDGVKGGLWSSDNTAIATINAVSGVLTGVSGGSVVITYTMGGGSCFVTYIVTVNPLPAVITGNRSVCQGLTTQLFDATGGGLWSSLGTAVATIEASSGIVSGVSAGTSLVSYTLIATGCASTAVVTVNRLPDPVSGNTNVCLGGTRTLSDSPSPGTWSSSNTAIATVDVLTGIVTGGAIGIDTITYTITATGCIMTTTIAVHALPAVFGVTGGGSYCQTTGGVHIGLSGSETGVIYLLYLGSTPAGTYTGTGHPLDFGLQVPGGTYTVIATNGFTTCSSNMSGSAVVTVIPYIVPTVSIGTSPGDTVCSGTVVTYTATATGGGAGPVYVWRVNGTGVGTGSAYSFIPANGDEVSVFMTSNVACAIPATVSDTVRMTVQTPVLPTVGIMASPGDTVCTGTAVTFTAVPSAGGSGPVYLWIVNGAFKGTGTVYTYTPADGDLVYCSMVSNYQCRLGDTVTGGPERMVADTPVIPVVTVVASPGRESGSYDTVRAVVVNGKSPRYQWFVNGIPVSGATTAMYVSNGFHYPKADSVGCVVVNSDACHESAFGWIYVTLHSLGVTHVTGGISDLSVIPNPNKGAFTVSGTLGGSADREVTIELTDMLGQKVYEEKTLARGGRLSRQITLSSTLANGMYMLSVRGDDGTHKVFHLVVEQ